MTEFYFFCVNLPFKEFSQTLCIEPLWGSSWDHLIRFSFTE